MPEIAAARWFSCDQLVFHLHCLFWGFFKLFFTTDPVIPELTKPC